MPFRLGANRIGRLVVGEVVVPWTPASFTDVQYWWTADAGVTESGGAVSQWQDQINNYNLVQATSANQPTISTSANMNGQNVVTFDGTNDFIYANVAPTSLSGADITLLAVYYLASTTPGSGIIFGNSLVGPSTGRMWVDGLNNTQRMWNAWASGGNGAVLENPITIDKHAFKLRYDSSAGDTFSALDTLTETSQTVGGTTGADYGTNTVLCMGATLNSFSSPTVFGSRVMAMEMAEAVVIHNTPSAAEMTEWKTYVNNKYGTIIS